MNPPWQNVGASRVLGECSTRCYLEMWSLKLPWYWDMSNAAKGRRHWIYFGKCSRKPCSQTLTFAGVLNSCAGLGALGDSRIVHEQLIRTGCNSDIFVGNSLVDVYAKCGSLEDALRVLKNMPSQDVVTWSALIIGSF